MSITRKAARMGDAYTSDDLAMVDYLLNRGITSMRPHLAAIARDVYGRTDVVEVAPYEAPVGSEEFE